MSDKQTSSENTQPTKIGANITAATGYVQETIGGIIGSESLTQQGINNREKGASDWETADKIQNSSAASGPNKTSGNYDAAVGGAKEEVGNLLGRSDIAQAGKWGCDI